MADRLRPDQLAVVQGGMMLAIPTARAYLAFEAAAKAEGWDPNITAPAGAFRSEAMVEDMWNSSPARRLAVYGVPLGGTVAKPRSLGGGGSVHENGRCVDIGNWGSIGQKRLDTLANKFGFKRTIASEGWHYQHDGVTAIGGGAGGGGSASIEGITMTSKLVLHKVGADMAYYLVDPFTTTIVTDQNDITAYREAYGEIVRGDELPAGVDPRVSMDPFIRMNMRNLAAIRGSIDDVIDDEAILAAVQKIQIGDITADLAPVLSAIAKSQTALASLIGQVDENTLATFGLKRA
jgi:hypothetical protein